jgi:proline iminopeptidase
VGYVQVDGARLYYRDIGTGRPILVLHGGPDFDHHYLLPEMDRLADSFRLIYYDQRGRGRSAEGVRAEDVSVSSDVGDLDRVRNHLGLEFVALLGHSWGGVLAMEYATRHPERVSRLILMNTAPGSADDCQVLREHLLTLRTNEEIEQMQTIAVDARYLAGDLGVEADYYRIHFRPALRSPELLEDVVGRLRTHFTEETVLLARAIEHRLYDETWRTAGYDLVPKLTALSIPTLVLRGEHDFIPGAVAGRIAEAMPRAQLCELAGCGHFVYLDSPDEVHEHITDFCVGTYDRGRRMC